METNCNVGNNLHLLDIIDTKIYNPKTPINMTGPKYTYTSTFDSKASDLIKLFKIFIHPYVVSILPENLQTKENIPTVAKQLGQSIKNKILNYKKTVNSIFIDHEVSVSLHTDKCVC